MWFETDGETTFPVAHGWHKEWVSEECYAWINGLRIVTLCALKREPTGAERADVEKMFANAEPPSLSIDH